MSVKLSDTGCILFDYKELSDATNGFDKTPVKLGGCKLGEGRFGPVYRGKLKFTEVAIKILRGLPKGDKEAEKLAMEPFETEVKVLTRFRHFNLVTLMGYSTNSSNPPCLVYEFMLNGTLEDALENGLQDSSSTQRSSKGIHLPWMCRLSLATDIARGLAYLHTADKKICIVHRNVKSSTVLLDLSFRAKLGSFWNACSLDEGSDEKSTDKVIGTSGYIPPEYCRGVVTTKMDAFAFGVILLELISGMPAYDPRRIPKDLFSYMEQDIELGLMNVLCARVDEHAGDWPSQSFTDLFRIANKCVQPKMTQRAEVAEVYPKLETLLTESAELYAIQEKYKNKTVTKVHN